MERQLRVSLAGGLPLGTLAAVLVLAWPTSPKTLPGAAAFKDGNPAVPSAAVGVAAEPAVLITALQDENPDVRLVAAQRLRGAGPRETAALIGALEDKHAGVRRESAESLSRIGAAAVP